MNRLLRVSALLCLLPLSALAEDSYIAFDKSDAMVVSGPFNLRIPRPGDARPAGPQDSHLSFLDENLTVSRAGYFGADQFLLVQVETTNAGPGTMSNKFLPVVTVGGDEFRGRKVCVDVSEDMLEATNDPLFDFVLDQKVKIVPAVLAMQLFAADQTGSALGTIVFMRNVPDGCAAMTPEFEEKFTADFERFIKSIRDANP